MRNVKQFSAHKEAPLAGENCGSYTHSNCLAKFLHWFITLDIDNSSSKNYGRMTETTNYIFFFGGRLRTITRSGAHSILVFSALVVPLVLFSIFECNALWHHRNANWKPAIVFLYYFHLLTISSFLRAACGDSGMVSRNIHVPDLDPLWKIPQEYYNHAILPTENLKAVVSMKYCQSCRIWRPPRSSHCSMCGVCVLTHDHHCIWMNNCIGQRNYRYFIEFLFSSTVSCVLMIMLSSFKLSYSHKASETPISIVIVCYCGLGIWYPLILFIYHIFLAGTQQTTHEYLRSIGSKNPIFHKITKIQDNPHDKHSFFLNIIHLWFKERGWILVDPRRDESYPGDIRFVKLPEAHSFESV